jgi:hypothetical protein
VGSGFSCELSEIKDEYFKTRYFHNNNYNTVTALAADFQRYAS